MLVYAFAGVAGLMFDAPDNTPALLNPLTYTEEVVRGDYFMDSTFNSETEGGGKAEAEPRLLPAVRILMPTDYTTLHTPRRGQASATARGLVAQSGLALLFLSLAALKWRSTRRDMLRDSET